MCPPLSLRWATGPEQPPCYVGGHEKELAWTLVANILDKRHAGPPWPAENSLPSSGPAGQGKSRLLRAESTGRNRNPHLLSGAPAPERVLALQEVGEEKSSKRGKLCTGSEIKGQ